MLGPPFDTRFVPVSSAYSFELRKAVFKAAHDLQFPSHFLAEGTYAWVSGPTYESPAEGRLLRAAGADVVGMSTVPEVVAAKQAGMDVVVLSLVTNPVVIPETYRSARAEVEAEVSEGAAAAGISDPSKVIDAFFFLPADNRLRGKPSNRSKRRKCHMRKC